DFSLLGKARTYERGFPLFLIDAIPFFEYAEHSVDYIYALLTGYRDAPAGTTLLPGQYWNEYMPDHAIAMPPPLSDGQVEYPKDAAGKPVVPETVDQYACDVAAITMWAAESHLEARNAMGFTVIIFVIVFTALLYLTKKKIWARA